MKVGRQCCRKLLCFYFFIIFLYLRETSLYIYEYFRQTHFKSHGNGQWWITNGWIFPSGEVSTEKLATNGAPCQI